MCQSLPPESLERELTLVRERLARHVVTDEQEQNFLWDAVSKLALGYEQLSESYHRLADSYQTLVLQIAMLDRRRSFRFWVAATLFECAVVAATWWVRGNWQ